MEVQDENEENRMDLGGFWSTNPSKYAQTQRKYTARKRGERDRERIIEMEF